MEKLEQLDIIVADRFKLVNYISSGTYGEIYEATDLNTKSRERVALKMERAKLSDSLTRESFFYEKLQKGKSTGMLKLHFPTDVCDEYRVMGMELLGPSLWDLRYFCGGKFSLKTALLIADQAICRLKSLHDQGIIHRDLKPDNFLMGRGREGNKIYLVDMGLAHEKVLAPGNPMNYNGDQANSFLGTNDYAPRAAHQLHCQTYRDDMESFGYVLIDLLKNTLPWSNMTTTIGGQSPEQQMGSKKRRITLDELCEDLPAVFKQYFEHVRSLRYNQRPNYSKLRQRFAAEFKRQGFSHDYVFDWTEKRFKEAIAEPAEEAYVSFSSSSNLS
ncbi:hypothetical protein ASPTUDRAFT_56635 [Aspergillus tubingensis CBS 134.48]|uniref:non-specific serine/threonine protein kinase n=1 Tax=Aspergillus tubingensis (strain CBS 134.48) TaxID=767770 RepID=A0A1L9N028_ASPTC|nr:hypothetical protein ASPTUDRAFT_56635 [Aspergillus tubingensis CBS 134.48]